MSNDFKSGDLVISPVQFEQHAPENCLSAN